MPRGSVAIGISLVLIIVAASLAVIDGRYVEAGLAAVAWLVLFAVWLFTARKSPDDSLPDA